MHPKSQPCCPVCGLAVDVSVLLSWWQSALGAKAEPSPWSPTASVGQMFLQPLLGHAWSCASAGEEVMGFVLSSHLGIFLSCCCLHLFGSCSLTAVLPAWRSHHLCEHCCGGGGGDRALSHGFAVPSALTVKIIIQVLKLALLKIFYPLRNRKCLLVQVNSI